MCITPCKRSAARGKGYTTENLSPEGVEPASGFREKGALSPPGYATLTRGYAHFTPVGVIAYNYYLLKERLGF